MLRKFKAKYRTADRRGDRIKGFRRQGRRARIHQKKMETCLNLKSRLDHKEAAVSHVKKYQELGWALQALMPLDGTYLEVDLRENPETWVSRWWGPGWSGSKMNLGVRTGKKYGLMVLEVATGSGESMLEPYGPWRAACIAALGAGREQHFYAWDPSFHCESASFRGRPEIRWFGEGQVVPVAPSGDPEMRETWEWLCPPWEQPPQCPSRSLSRFFQQHLTPEPRPEISLSWQQVYCLVSPYQPLLQALSASYPSRQDYYLGVLEAAAAVGLQAPEVLMSLLWHAPRGNARQHPEIWDYLRNLVAEAQPQIDPATSPGNTPWELLLDKALLQARETSARGSEHAADKPGPPCFLQRRLAEPPHPGATRRTPFSCR